MLQEFNGILIAQPLGDSLKKVEAVKASTYLFVWSE
jgi:hypothetical protein